MKKISSVKIIGNLFLVFCCILAVGPITLGILRSLFKDSMFTEFNHFSSYLTVITSDVILPAFLNTIFITLISVPLNIAIVALAAYGFSKFQFKGKKNPDYADRCTGYRISDHCRSYLSACLRKTEYFVPISAKSRDTDCICGAGNYSGNSICNVSVCFPRTSSGAGIHRNR